jgi:hypothetical protein
MAVISTPISARLVLTYPGQVADQRINGINPTAVATQFTGLITAIESLQTEYVDDAFLTVESALTEA